MKRWLTLLLCVSLLAGLLSGCAGAESPDRAALQAGDAVLFGRFEQDGDEADGAL